MQKDFFYQPTYPIFFRTITGNKQFIFLGLIQNDAKKMKKDLNPGT